GGRARVARAVVARAGRVVRGWTAGDGRGARDAVARRPRRRRAVAHGAGRRPRLPARGGGVDLGGWARAAVPGRRAARARSGRPARGALRADRPVLPYDGGRRDDRGHWRGPGAGRGRTEPYRAHPDAVRPGADGEGRAVPGDGGARLLALARRRAAAGSRRRRGRPWDRR